MSPNPDLEKAIGQLIANENLPDNFRATVDSVYRPLAKDLAARARTLGKPLIVGVNGAQGTGKSTLTRFLTTLLERGEALPTASFSLDDIYLTKAAREELARSVHPMLVVRGVPGTHDIPLGNAVIDSLCRADASSETLIPSFDKAVDDRRPTSQWPVFVGQPRVIIVEGWCAGAPPEPESALSEPINDLEMGKDCDGQWRRYVNEQLATVYRDFFNRFDVLVLIKTPSWEMVYQWRLLQEEKLRARCEAMDLDDSGVMSSDAVAEFVQYYERITRHSLKEMPARVDYLLEMDENHKITAVHGLAKAPEGGWPES